MTVMQVLAALSIKACLFPFKIEPMTGEAMYDQSYVFEDINYVNKDTSKKDSTLLEIMTLLKEDEK